jgi:hypothetical protein
MTTAQASYLFSFESDMMAAERSLCKTAQFSYFGGAL